MRTKAAVARRAHAPLSIEELDLDEPGEGEILVRVVASGVGARDREAIAGTLPIALPFVPGCAGAGIVERLGPGVTTPAAGEAVVILPAAEPAVPRAGPALRGSDGPVGRFFGQSSFATHLLCRAAFAVPVPDGAPLELLAGLGGEILLGAGLVLGDLAITPDNTLVVTGADATGLGACMAAAAVGAKTIVLADPDERRRALALETGATVAVPSDDGLAAVVKGLNGDGARYALDAVGTAASRTACLASLAPDGRCRVVGEAGASLDAAGTIARLVALHAEGRFPLETLIGFFPFEHVDDALAALASGDVVKPVVRFSLGAFGELDRALQEGAAHEQPDAEPDSEPSEAPADAGSEAPPVTA